MGRELARLVFDGADVDFIWFSVLSRSRGAGTDPLYHTVAICKRTGHMSCSCEDSTFRSKGDSILSPHPQLCWHGRAVLEWTRRMVAGGG